MIPVLWSIITGNPIARLIGKVLGIALAVLTFGAWQRQRGAQSATAKRDVADAKETIKAHEVRNDVEDRIDRGGSAKQRLRERWRKP